MKHVFFSIIVLIYNSIHAIIIEVQSFQEIAPYLTQDTLLTPKQMLGSDVWFENRIAQQKALGLSPIEAFKKTLNEWEGIRHFTEMQLVEPHMEKIINDLQKKAHVIIGLSTQSLALSEVTCKQLQNNRIDLRLTAPNQKSYYFQNENKGVLYTYGILFTAGTAKGQALFKLFELIEKRYHRIVFINDKASHLAELEETVKNNCAEFIGLRYGYSDSRKKAFDPIIAEIQLHLSGFTHILSDIEAKEFLQKSDLFSIKNSY